MKIFIVLLSILIILSCTPEKNEAVKDSSTNEIESQDPSTTEETSEETKEPEPLPENVYLVEELPDEIYYKLCGAWSFLSGPPDSEQEFSWGIGKYHMDGLLIIDLGTDPPTFAAGSQGVSYAEILTVEDLGNDLYKLNLLYKHREKEHEFIYIIGIYHDGFVDLIEKPELDEPTEVMVIFPERQKKVVAIDGLFKDYTIDYEMIKKELKNLNTESEKHILEEDYENE